MTRLCAEQPHRVSEKVESSRRPPAISFNKTHLHVACIFQAPKDVISDLLNAHHDAIREKDESGKLPLHRAVSSSGICASFEVIELLVKAYPTSISIKDSTNLTPIKLARRVEARPEIIEILGAKKRVATSHRKLAGHSNLVLSENANDFFNEDVKEKVNDAPGAEHDTLDIDIDDVSDLPSFNRTNNVNLSNEAFAYRFCSKRDFVNAKKYLEMAIEDVILLKGESDLKVAHLCNDLGNVNFELNDFKCAQKSYREALRVQNLSLMGRANVIFNLGNVHFKQNDMHQASTYYDGKPVMIMILLWILFIYENLIYCLPLFTNRRDSIF